jgi:hypothetical protein
MPENYEVIYTHPGGATARFVRQGGELDALAKGLDSEQFWIFKQVKALLVRNEPGDVGEANRMMAAIGFANIVQEIAPAPVAVAAAGAQAARGAVSPAAAMPAVAYAHEEHVGPHAPQPSIWPLWLALSAALTLISLVFIQVYPGSDFPYSIIVTAIGLALVLVCMIGWGTESFHVEL